MDDKAITLAAQAAISDLELECEIEKVSRAADGDKWSVQFSANYGEFRDDFKNQFGKENSSKVVREKVKGYLLKQVTKIRSTTGKSRRPRASLEDRETSSRGSKGSYNFIDDAFDRASTIVREIGERASGIADTARATVSDVAKRVTPVTIEVESIPKQSAGRTTQARGKSVANSKAEPKKPAKAIAARAKAKASAKLIAKKAGKKGKPSPKKAKTGGRGSNR